MHINITWIMLLLFKKDAVKFFTYLEKDVHPVAGKES
jgi:hypothetical protein